MSLQPDEDVDDVALDGEWVYAEDDDLGADARVGITIGTTFAYKQGHQHWPKVWMEDKPQMLVAVQLDEDGERVVLLDEDEQPLTRPESGEECLARLRRVARKQLDSVIAEMKEDIDRRAQEDALIRQAAARRNNAPEENEK